MVTTAAPDLETLASFVPARLVRRFAANPAPLSAPESERFQAAVLFADISGFSPLAERLAQRGPAGAEELTAILTGCFERLIGLIHEHGGDVIKFAGDALLALWEATDQDLGMATCRAAQCALAVRAVLHHYEVGDGTRLSVHSGVGAGEVTMACVGGQLQRWELLVSGPPLIQIGLAGKQAAPGEVVVSGAAWAHLRLRARGVALNSGDWRLEAIEAPALPAPQAPVRPGAEAEAALRACIPRAVLARLGTGQDAWLAELRNLTILFVNLPDLTETLPLKRAQAVMSAMQSALYRFEGSVNQLVADDKGIILVAALGLPPLAHEDDALRGVQAAQAIQARLRGLGIRSAIGVSSGRVFCGAVGGAGRRQYTVVGDVVNVAARLMQAAPGDILCDAATYRAAQHRLQFEPLPPIPMKGKGEPVAVYRPYCPVPVAPGLRPMFGRAAEQAEFSLMLAKLKAGEGGVAIIEGDPGIGKSRLVAEFQAQARDLGIQTLAGAGDAIEKSTPSHAWRPVFAQVFGVDELHSTAIRRAQVSERLAGDSEALRHAPLLDSVLALDLPDNEITAQMSGQVRADNTHDLLLRILEVEARRAPTALILEDAHWLDSASWALAALVAQRLPSILLVIATRPLADPLPPEFRHLVGTAGAQRFRLEALSDGAVVELVCERLGVRALPAVVIRLIQQKAQGNPFFSEELIYALRDAGLILIERGECRIAPGVELSAVRFPDSVQGVITSRMDRLPPSQQLTLKVASVIGRVFAMRVLRDIFPIEAERAQLPDYLQTLDRLDLTPLESPAPDLAYIFKHVITQEVAYNLMLFAQRRKLHRAAAEWYETAQAEDLAPFYPLLAHHWRRAQHTEKAIDYFERAGEQAMRNGAFDEAIKFFGAALELEPGLAGDSASPARRSRRARWESALGDALMGLGQLASSRIHCERALEQLDESLPKSRAGLVWLIVSNLVRQLTISLWRPLSSKVTATSDDDRCLAGATLERLGQILYYDGDLMRGVGCIMRAINVSESAGTSVSLARHLATGSVAFSIIPVRTIAERYAARAEQVAELFDDQPSRAWIYELTGLYNMGLGRWTEGARRLQEAIAIADRIGDWRRWIESTVNFTATFTYSRGDFAECASQFEKVRAAGERRGDAQAQLWGHVGRALALFRLGDLREAAGLLETAKALISGATSRSEMTWLHGALASVRLRQGQFESALAEAETTLRTIQGSYPAGNWILEGWAGMAETFCGIWEAIEAREFAADGFDRKRCLAACKALCHWTHVFPFARARSLMCEARVARLHGRQRKAENLLEEALLAAGKAEMPLEQAMAQFEMARFLPHADPQRAKCLANAGSIFERLGARHDLALVRALETKSGRP